MKKKIVAMMLASMMAFNLIGCGETQKESNAPEEKQESIESEEGSDEKESAESTPVPTVEAADNSDDEIVVTDPLICPTFTAEKNTSAMVDQIAFTAKDYAPNLSDDQANQIISAIREAGHKFYNGPEEMEKYMWYGYLLDYKYDDLNPRSALGTDLVQAIKYCYRNVELATDESTQINLEQVDKDLNEIQ